MILIFDTYCGLCNQIADINQAINYCIVNNYKFSFRKSCLRNNNLTSFFFIDFNKLLDYKYINYNLI